MQGIWPGSGSSSGGGSTSGTSILKGNGSGGFANATGGTDFVAPGGALGTPSSGTLTNCTGLPTTGIAGPAVKTIGTDLGNPSTGHKAGHT